MKTEKIYNLIDETYDSFVQLRKDFNGQERIDIMEKEESFYKTKFKELGIKPIIVSDIDNISTHPVDMKSEIQFLKDNLEKKLIKN